LLGVHGIFAHRQPTRVEAVINVAEPTLLSKVSSLLGLVNCSAKFRPNLETGNNCTNIKKTMLPEREV